ncbi:MAG: hypothetical protein JWQ19_3929 [Subtercola sp.]|nr:hypothetical protein [Subtercola sp.]
MKVKVMCNIWGNWNCFEGVNKIEFGCDKYRATEWLSERLLKGDCELSDKSYLTMEDVKAFRAKHAEYDARTAEREKRRG